MIKKIVPFVLMSLFISVVGRAQVNSNFFLDVELDQGIHLPKTEAQIEISNLILAYEAALDKFRYAEVENLRNNKAEVNGILAKLSSVVKKSSYNDKLFYVTNSVFSMFRSMILSDPRRSHFELEMLKRASLTIMRTILVLGNRQRISFLDSDMRAKLKGIFLKKSKKLNPNSGLPKYLVTGAYNCKNTRIYLDSGLEPYNLAGLVKHELNHLFVDKFGILSPLSEKDLISATIFEESMSALTASIFQLDFVQKYELPESFESDLNFFTKKRGSPSREIYRTLGHGQATPKNQIFSALDRNPKLLTPITKSVAKNYFPKKNVEFSNSFLFHSYLGLISSIQSGNILSLSLEELEETLGLGSLSSHASAHCLDLNSKTHLLAKWGFVGVTAIKDTRPGGESTKTGFGAESVKTNTEATQPGGENIKTNVEATHPGGENVKTSVDFVHPCLHDSVIP